MSGINTLLGEIYINSSAPYRDPGGTNEDFFITENGRHFGPPKTPKRVRVTRASIPYTWFNTTAANNAFEILESGVPFAITIPPGNYDGTSLAAALQNAIGLIGGLGNTYTVTFSPTTYRLTFTATPGTFQLNFSVANSAALLLGFLTGSTTVDAGSVTAPNMVGLLPDFEIFICTDLVQGCDNGLVMWNTSPPSNTQIIAKVSVNGSYGSVLNYVGYEYGPFFDMRGSLYAAAATSTAIPAPPRTMHFWLQFPSGLPVDLNGAHWSATLLMDWGSEINV